MSVQPQYLLGPLFHYSDGSMTDSIACKRLFGFDSTVRQKLVDFEGEPLVLANWQIKQSRVNNDDPEILVTSKTELGMSPKKVHYR